MAKPARTTAPNLFSAAGLDDSAPRPLADKLRPQSLAEVVGQDHLLGPDGALTRMLETRSLGSLIFWGPPGTGKTTVARLLATATDLYFEQISAVFSGVADLKKVFDAATARRETGQGTLLFGAVLHHRQKGILLRPVETVHLVDEQQRALPGLAPRGGGIEHLLEVGDAREHRRDLLEVEIGRGGEQPRHRGFSGAGRAPEDQRTERARLQHAGERAVGTEQVILADHLGEALRTQLVGER